MGERRYLYSKNRLFLDLNLYGDSVSERPSLPTILERPAKGGGRYTCNICLDLDLEPYIYLFGLRVAVVAKDAGVAREGGRRFPILYIYI